MNLAEDVNIEEFVMSKEELSGADIKAVCTEAGLLALRERRMKAGASAPPSHRCGLRVAGRECATRTHADHASRFQEGQGKGAVQEEGGRAGGSLLVGSGLPGVNFFLGRARMWRGGVATLDALEGLLTAWWGVACVGDLRSSVRLAPRPRLEPTTQPPPATTTTTRQPRKRRSSS